MSKHGITHTTPKGGNIFADLGFDPIEAANLKLRAEVMASIEQWIADTGVRQRTIGERLGVSQARISDLKRGKIDKFSLDMLVGFAAKLGMTTELVIKAA
jgi:predicted XRE-type DNA-binding protein